MKTKIRLAAFATSLLFLVTFAFAAFPDRNVNYIIPFGPGGESDITARHQQSFFKDKFGENLVISYKPGGGGAVGWSQLNKMKGDGYTMMGINLPHIIIKPEQKNVGFRTKDITGIYMFHYTPDAIVVKKNSPFKTLKDVIRYAKRNPRKLTFSGSGKGTANHLAQVRFDKMARIRTTYVSFKGTGKAVASMLGSHVRAEWGYTSVGTKHADKVRMLAVAMEKRHPRFPNVPTFKELGFNLVSGAYRGIAVPKSTPRAVRVKLSNMIKEINADPKFRKRMEDDGMALLDIDEAAYPAFIRKMRRIYIRAARSAKIIK